MKEFEPVLHTGTCKNHVSDCEQHCSDHTQKQNKTHSGSFSEIQVSANILQTRIIIFRRTREGSVSFFKQFEPQHGKHNKTLH